MRALRNAATAAAVLVAGCSAVELTWDQPPDDAALEHEVRGYRIFLWTETDRLVTAIDIPDPEARTHRIRRLPPGEYRIGMVAYDDRGVRSELSNVLIKTAR